MYTDAVCEPVSLQPAILHGCYMIWWDRRDSNPQDRGRVVYSHLISPTYRSGPLNLARPIGFEPTSYGLEHRCLNPLDQGRIVWRIVRGSNSYGIAPHLFSRQRPTPTIGWTIHANVWCKWRESNSRSPTWQAGMLAATPHMHRFSC